jgi:methionyl-tRNA formyltransferase
LYRRLEHAAVDLFTETWPLVREGKAPRQTQVRNSGTCHRSRDVERIDEIDLTATYKAKDLINLLRARTFPPYRGAYYRSGDRKIFLRLELAYAEEGDR